MSQYRKGYRAEREAMQYMFEKYGAYCVRASGSHGIADLICADGNHIYIIQVKYGKKKPYINFKELEGFAKKFNAIPMLLYRKQHGDWIEITSEEQYKNLKV